MSGALLVAGTTSDAGKSMVVAGLCRLLARKGIRVAPFKAQNMSNNSAVTADGGEIGRAQAMQARAAGLAPSVRFNPVLLKPGSDRTSQLVRPRPGRRHRWPPPTTSRTATGSPRWSPTNWPRCEANSTPSSARVLARPPRSTCGQPIWPTWGWPVPRDLPVVLVGDIDRGGLLAHLFGTVAVLEPEDQRLICGFVVNKFRGDPALLAPGLTSCTT